MMGLLSSCPMRGAATHYPLVEVSGKLCPAARDTWRVLNPRRRAAASTKAARIDLHGCSPADTSWSGVPLDEERARSTERGVGPETQRLFRYQAQAGKACAQFLEH